MRVYESRLEHIMVHDIMGIVMLRVAMPMKIETLNLILNSKPVSQVTVKAFGGDTGKY